MSLIAFASPDRRLQERLRSGLDRTWHDLVSCPGWPAVLRTVKERPVGVLAIDMACLRVEGCSAIVGLRRDFPSLPVVILSRPGSARGLFELGRGRVGHLGLAEADMPPVVLARIVGRAADRSGAGLTVRALSGLLPSSDLHVLRGALEVVHRCWSADRLARSFGLSRPVLSERLKTVGLPSIGHLMVWARLLHAGHWLPDPGRSGESVARQLEYADGSAFRRALRNYVGATPSGVVAEGGLSFVLEAFALRHAESLVTPRAQVA